MKDAGPRRTRWHERGQVLRSRAEAARADHAWVEFWFSIAEQDAAIGGGLLAGAIAYRLFVLLLPTSLLLVSGLGLYAGSVDKKPSTVVREAGLHGLIGSQITHTASGHGRAVVFVLMIPAVLYALVTLYRALARVYGIVWQGSARGIRTAPRGVATLGGALIVQLASGAVVAWLRRGHQYGWWLGMLAYVALMGTAWLAVSLELPHGDVRWPKLIPGAVLFGAGLFLIGIFNIFVTAQLVQGRADTYGALGVATALLFSLVLVGRLMVVSAELNASLGHPRNADARIAQSR